MCIYICVHACVYARVYVCEAIFAPAIGLTYFRARACILTCRWHKLIRSRLHSRFAMNCLRVHVACTACSVAGGTQIGIIDPEPDQRPELPPAVLRKAPTHLDTSDLSAEELAQAKLLRQRNQHSTLHGPVEDFHGTVAEIDKRDTWDLHEGPQHHLPMHVPRRHKNDNTLVEKMAHKAGYRQWSKEQYCGHTQGKAGHRCFVCTQRSKLQPDPSIKHKSEAAESEATKRLQELTLRQHKVRRHLGVA